jgi:hypothetical protein
MSKPDRKPAPDIEPEYDVADVEHEDTTQLSYNEVVDPEYDTSADPEYDDTGHVEYVAEVVDPECGEVAELPGLAEPEQPELPVALAPETTFAFEVGLAVMPLTQQQPSPVVWRGHLKERHPTTGLLHRVPVYRLDDGYWDCYREEELQVA